MMTSLITYLGTGTPSNDETTGDSSPPTANTEAAEGTATDAVDDASSAPSGDAPDAAAGTRERDSAETEPERTDDDDVVEEPELPLDVTFEILKNRRRRLVLEYLEESGDSTAIGELAEHIAAIENGIDVRQLDSQQRKRVYIGLYQCHLPKMDDAGVVDFEQNRGQVELAENAQPLYEYLDAGDEEEPETGENVHRQYMVLTALLGVSFAAAQMANVQLVANALVAGFCVVSLALAYVHSDAAFSTGGE